MDTQSYFYQQKLWQVIFLICSVGDTVVWQLYRSYVAYLFIHQDYDRNSDQESDEA